MKNTRKTAKAKNNVSKKAAVRTRGIDGVVATIAVGIVLGIALIALGVFNHINSDYNNLNLKTEEELTQEISEKIKQVEDVRTRKNEEYATSAISEEYKKLSHDLVVVEDELYELESQLGNIQSGVFDDLKNKNFVNSVPLIVAGIVVIVVSFGLAMRKSANKKRNVILTISEEKSEKKTAKAEKKSEKTEKK